MLLLNDALDISVFSVSGELDVNWQYYLQYIRRLYQTTDTVLYYGMWCFIVLTF
jgi:hypothetical protein